MNVTAIYKHFNYEEGDIVCLKNDKSQVFLVTVPCRGHDYCQKGTFWLINLTGNRVSGGNYLKELFEPFHGKITIEVD